MKYGLSLGYGGKMKEIRILDQRDYAVSQWAGGETTQLALYPPSGDYARREFLWRVSTATIEIEESTFSELDGYMRYLMLFEGQLALNHPSLSEERNIVLKPFQVYTFDGGLDTKSKGLARDFNLMVGNHAKGSMSPLQLKKDESKSISVEHTEGNQCTCLIYVYRGNVIINALDQTIGVGEGQSAIFDCLEGMNEITLKNEGVSEVLGAIVQVVYK